MKRVIASVALTITLSALPGLAGATPDLSLQDPPGAPHIGTAMCLPAVPGGQVACPAPPVGTVTPGVELSPVVSLPAVPVVTPPAVPAVAPPVVPSAADAAYGARLHAELCAARPVFCEVDQSGKYLTQ